MPEEFRLTVYERCAADGCAKRPRKWSRYCEGHTQRIRRTGAVDGRILRKQELKPYRDIAWEWVDRNREHPATVAALEWLAALIEPGEAATFLAAEMERLRNGADPRDMLAAVIAVWLFEQTTARPFSDDRVFDTNTGRALLRCAPQRVTSVARSGRKDHRRIRGSHALSLGAHVRQALGALPLLAAKAIADDVLGPERTAERIRAGLAVPFQPATKGAGTTATTTGDDE